MKIVFTGDLSLIGDLKDYNGKIIDLDVFRNADKRVVNLENPISDNHEVADKCVLYSGKDSLSILKKMNINYVNLANNHIQDKGNEGIKDTLVHLLDNNIKSFGAGSNLEEASKALEIAKDIFILGYCQYNSPTLNQIQLAEETSPGVNPLSYEKIISDLEMLPKGSKCVLYLHWGREHVWLTEAKNIDLAKKLLQHEKVLHIVGMHPHRVQGYLKQGCKKAYFSLGNFLFPNFYYDSPSVLCYPSEEDKRAANIMTTRQYHSVSRLTYKKWRLVNRISLLLEFDTSTLKLRHIPVVQNYDTPEIRKLTGLKLALVSVWLKLINVSYLLPRFIYNFIEKISSKIVFVIWYIQIVIFKTKQNGASWLFKFIKQTVNGL